MDSVVASDDTTAIVHFRSAPPSFPLILCELPILPSHLLAQTPRDDMRRAAFNFAPVGNGPFRFVERRAGERWVFRAERPISIIARRAAHVAGLVVSVVDEPTTKFAGLASGDLDVAGISPATAPLASRDPSMRVIDYPVLFFDRTRVQRAQAAV